MEVIKDIPYRAGGRRAHTLDIYVPLGPRFRGRVALYVHGGGFGILSKESHWFLALMLAARGTLVFTINYRLAPKDPYPAAVEDVCDAYRWVVENAHQWGGDPEQMILAGDSAGANLITALTLATCYRRDETWARRVWQTGISPVAVLPTSGIFQVSDCARFGRRRKMAPFVGRILEGVERTYLTGVDRNGPHALDFADPLCVFERGDKLDRPLPPFFIAVGTRDPLLDDSRRLATALSNLGGVCEVHYAPRQIHVFHAALWRPAARKYWRAAFGFVDGFLDDAVAASKRGTAAPSSATASRKSAHHPTQGDIK